MLCRYSLFTGDVFGNGSIIVDLVHVLEANTCLGGLNKLQCTSG